MARGRKYGMSLTVVPPALLGGRPAPPAELDVVEQRIWKSIVDALPPGWLDAAASEVLTRAVAQAAVAAAQEALLRELRSHSPLEWMQSASWRPRPSMQPVPRRRCIRWACCERPRGLAWSRDGARRQLAQVPRVRPWEEASDG